MHASLAPITVSKPSPDYRIDDDYEFEESLMDVCEQVCMSKNRRVRLILATCLVGALMLVSSCIEPGEGIADIVSVNVSPSSIPQNDTGMTDETIDVSMTVAGFAGQITEADVFLQLQNNERDAQKDDFVVEGNTIELVGITKSFFGNLDPGDYQLGATVTSDAGEFVQELDLATVSITP
jgi:hypothetical protein